jgi:GT2 family glycosyltransferase
MAADRTLVIVNYHSAVLTREAMVTARAASSVALETVVVDNSCDEEEAARLQSIGADRVIISERNAGYGAAMNRGASAAAGDYLLLSNPDVVFLDQAVDTLFGGLPAGRSIAGPKFFWDQAGQWLLPPAERAGRLEKLEAIMATRSRRWRAERDRRRFLDRLAFWRLQGPASVPALSGAVLAIRRDTFRDTGGFDERFFLFFEETDLMRRIRGAGGSIAYIPEAVCRHLYAQTPSDDRDVHFAKSEAEYFRKWSGPWLASVAGRFARPDDAASPPAGAAIGVPDDGQQYVAELSPLPSFETAAGNFPMEGSVSAPRDILSSFRGGKLFLRLVNGATGEAVAAVTVGKPLE